MMNERPLLTLHLRLAMLNVLYYRNPPARYGVRLVVGSRNWLRPGEYLWSLTVKQTTPAKYRKRRSAWRRPVYCLNMPPAAFAWQYRPKQARKRRSRKTA